MAQVSVNHSACELSSETLPEELRSIPSIAIHSPSHLRPVANEILRRAERSHIGLVLPSGELWTWTQETWVLFSALLLTGRVKSFALSVPLFLLPPY